jgi:hypothetical protein
MTHTFKDAIQGPWTEILGTGTEYRMTEEDGVLTVRLQGMDTREIRDYIASGFVVPWIVGGVLTNLGLLFKWHEFLGGSDFLDQAENAMTIVFNSFSQGAATSLVGLAWLRLRRPDLWAKTYVVAWGQHRSVWATRRHMARVFSRVDDYHISDDPVTWWGWPYKLAGHHHVYPRGVWPSIDGHDIDLYKSVDWEAVI